MSAPPRPRRSWIRLRRLGQVIIEEIRQEDNPQPDLFSPSEYGDLLVRQRRMKARPDPF